MRNFLPIFAYLCYGLQLFNLKNSLHINYIYPCGENKPSFINICIKILFGGPANWGFQKSMIHGVSGLDIKNLRLLSYFETTPKAILIPDDYLSTTCRLSGNYWHQPIILSNNPINTKNGLIVCGSEHFDQTWNFLMICLVNSYSLNIWKCQSGHTLGEKLSTVQDPTSQSVSPQYS